MKRDTNIIAKPSYFSLSHALICTETVGNPKSQKLWEPQANYAFSVITSKLCTKDCIFSPYFPSNDPQKFALVHKVFGEEREKERERERERERESESERERGGRRRRWPLIVISLDLPSAIIADATRLLEASNQSIGCRRILKTLHRTFESANDASGRSPNSRGARNSNSTYSYGIRLARIDFPRFGGGNLPNWTEFTSISIDHFGEIDDDLMSDLIKLRQTGIVVEYHDQFDVITSRLDLSDIYLLSISLGGLKKDIQMIIKMFQPQDLRKAFHLAKLHESASASNIPTKFSLKSLSTYTNTKAILPTPKPLNKTTGSQLTLHTNQRHSNKKLTPAFMTERRSKGLCYFSDEPYNPTHPEIIRLLKHILLCD
ncbi:hypothetical protein V8G54_037311 [Vigna mungo]|uniref:LOB domain-containing protein n=1 Tax=Vigna mungo TaxID=3915 RepID=A0AAQ3RGD9_VIGMU